MPDNYHQVRIDAAKVWSDAMKLHKFLRKSIGVGQVPMISKRILKRKNTAFKNIVKPDHLYFLERQSIVSCER